MRGAVGGRGRAVAVERAIVEPAPLGHGVARPQLDPVPLAQPPDGRLPGRDPGAPEIEPLLRARERPEIAAPADALPRFQDGDAQAARAELAGRRRAGETGADDQHVAALFRHRGIPLRSAIVIRPPTPRQPSAELADRRWAP